MKITSGLNKQIFLALAVVGLFPLLVMAFQNHNFAKKTIENVEKEHLSFSLRSRLLWLRTWVSHTRQDFYHLAFDDGGNKDLSDEEVFLLSAQKLFKGHITYRSISLYRPDWSLLVRYPEGFKEKVKTPSDHYKDKLASLGGLFVVGEDYRNAGNEVIMPVGQGLLNRKGELGAFIIAEINLSRSLDRILGDTSDLNEGGRYILANENGKILYRSSAAGSENAGIQCAENKVPPAVLDAPPWEVKKLESCAGDEVYAVKAPIPEFQWLLISNFGTTSALSQFKKYIFSGFVTAFFTLVFLFFLAKNLSRRLASPLDELARVARQIREGERNERLPYFKEDYVKDVGEAFNSMMDALERQQQAMVQSTTLSAVGKMSSSLVHEMRNPLSSIKINLQALARKVKDDEGFSEMAAIALMQVDRLEAMFDDLLQFSKPLEVRKQPITFMELVDEVLTSVESSAVIKGIELKVDDKLQDVLFHADKEHSCRALSNLVGNAIQWSQAGTAITIIGRRPSEDEGVAVIQVADTGPGLQPEQMEKVFQPFFTTRELGTGLGLANVKKVMDYQGGSVLAENNPDGGAIFSIVFKD